MSGAEKTKTTTGLNARQKILFRVLSDHYSDWVKQSDLIVTMRLFSPDYCTGENNTDFHSTTARRILTADIRAINASAEIEKVIIHSDKGVKIATAEEARERLEAEYITALRKLALVEKMRKKIGLNGQYTIDGDCIKAVVE